MRAWREQNRDRARKLSREWRNRKLAADPVAVRAAENEKTKRNHAALKEEVFLAYGGWKCNCCGEKERNFLSLDHVNNDAYKLIKEGVHPKGTTRLYAWLRRNKFPAGFQVLCMNCNFGKRMNGGMCPHQVRRNDYGASQ